MGMTKGGLQRTCQDMWFMVQYYSIFNNTQHMYLFGQGSSCDKGLHVCMYNSYSAAHAIMATTKRGHRL